MGARARVNTGLFSVAAGVLLDVQHMAVSRTKRRFLGARVPTRPAALHDALAEAETSKLTVRQALLNVATRPRFVTDASPLSLAAARLAQDLPSSAPDPSPPSADMARRPTCTVTYDAGTMLTTMLGGAEIHKTMEEIAPLVDPRSWDRGGGVIAKVFPVRDVDGEYEPSTDLDDVPLGTPWSDGLLYEYARSEVSAFENILAIPKFTVTKRGRRIQEARADYYLYECLRCVVGLFSTPGGLTVNTGYVVARPAAERGWTRVTVQKTVKVRDFTPTDPGNRYDFGEWANNIIGSTLSLFVQDISLLSPFA